MAQVGLIGAGVFALLAGAAMTRTAARRPATVAPVTGH
jgi:hypothetical protein